MNLLIVIYVFMFFLSLVLNGVWSSYSSSNTQNEQQQSTSPTDTTTTPLDAGMTFKQS